MVFRVIEYGLLLLLALSIVTQIIVPSVKGTKLFPSFRKNRRILKDEQCDLKEKLEVKEMEARNNQLKVEIKENSQTNQEV